MWEHENLEGFVPFYSANIGCIWIPTDYTFTYRDTILQYEQHHFERINEHIQYSLPIAKFWEYCDYL